MHQFSRKILLLPRNAIFWQALPEFGSSLKNDIEQKRQPELSGCRFEP
jgi:hypothetical protein